MANQVNAYRWFQELEVPDSPYERKLSSRVGGQFVTKYEINIPEKATASTEKAERIIRALLAAHSEFCACFQEDHLQEEIRTNLYVVINGNAVCFSQEPRVKRAEYRDCLSEGYAERPVRCTKGHLFDLSRLNFWVEKNRNRQCPISQNHPIGTLEVNEEVAEEIRQYREQKKEKDERTAAAGQTINTLEEQVAAAREQVAAAQQTIGALEEVQAEQGAQIASLMLSRQQKINLAADAGKVFSKLAIYVVPKVIKKVAERIPTVAAGVIIKTVPRVAIYGIPIIGMLFGLAAGIYRFCKGQWVRGSGEILSGAVSCLSLVPAVGPGLAIGAVILIDAAIAAGDVYEVVAPMSGHPAVVADKRSLYRVLDLDPDTNPTKEQVDRAYQQQMQFGGHPDVHEASAPGSVYAQKSTAYAQLVNRTKARIYALNHWE